MDFLARYEAAFRSSYPDAARRMASLERELVAPTLISPSSVKVAPDVLTQASDAVKAFDRLRRSRPYVSDVCSRAPLPASADPGNRSVLMSYDFHLLPDGTLKLIEINTNASLSLMGDVAYRASGLPNPFGLDFRSEILATFVEEARLSKLGREPRSVAIVDRAPESQKLYVEFLAYQELFRTNGFDCDILDATDLSESSPPDLVYCRDTDFYFSDENSRAVRAAFESGASCVTPNPFEYQLLADKRRLIELADPSFLLRVLPGDGEDSRARDAVSRCLLRSRPVASFDPAELWADRKRWFFKPSQAFGGKAAYRGASIGRKAFEAMFAGDFVAQEYAPPPVLDGFKWDLRFFAYQDRVQLGLARLYRGQTTNFQEPGGGIACLVASD